jgi:acyl-CoA synthetase (AMP-forming)/AMP-acid ligase II
MLLHDLIEFAASATMDESALIAGEQEWTFGQLLTALDAMRNDLLRVAASGTTVMVVAENTPGFVVALYAVPAAGMVLAMGNTRHSDAELWQTINASGSTVVLGTASHIGRIRESAPPGGELPTLLEFLPDTPRIKGPPKPRRRQDLPEVRGAALPQVREDDTAWLIYTSGTTGRPKGAMLTHRSLISAALNTTTSRPIASDEVYLFPFPLFHVAAYNVIHHHLLRRPVVLLESFEPVAAMAAIERHRVTSVSLAPTMVAMLLDHPRRPEFDLSGLRQISYGAAAMPLDVLRRTLAELPHVGLAQGYGMTELSGNAVFLGPEEHRRAATTEPQLLSAAGRPAPLARLRITRDDDTEAGPGEVGEILVRSDQVCAGYHNDAGATAEAFLGDWFRTGDVGRIDEAGYLHIVDRKKDIIITGGENVSSREVEDALSTHPSIAQVAVIGVPDDRWGERVTAVVTVAAGATVPTVGELKEWAADLAGFKRPRAVVEVDEMPLNASGKVEKRRLRDQLSG